MGNAGNDGRDAKWGPIWTAAALVVLPVFYLLTMLVLRSDAGPFWLWHASQPTYTYLLDSVNLLHFFVPGQVDAPGTPVQAIAALVLLSVRGFADAESVTAAVFADPEAHLRAVTMVLFALTAFAMVAVGVAARLATGRLIPALLAQAGPLMSTVALRHGLALGPEALIVPTVLTLGAVAFLAVRPGRVEGHGVFLAAAFGVVAGFGLAVEFAALPVFVLPLFLLTGVVPLAVYLGTTLAAFVLFTLPAAGAYGSMVAAVAAWVGQKAAAANGADYVRAVIIMGGRPALFVPILLALSALAATWWRSRRGHPYRGAVVRALAGVLVAQIILILVAARRPGAEQLIPGLVLSGVMLALIYEAVADFDLATERVRFWGREATVILFGLFLMVQTAVIVGQDIRLRERRADAGRIDNADFEQCLRVYFRSASDPGYAMFVANQATGANFADLLAAAAPRNDVWIDARTGVSRDWYGRIDLLEYLAVYPCAFFRGSDRRVVDAYLYATVPGLVLRDDCSVRNETVLTMGVDCRGALTGQ